MSGRLPYFRCYAPDELDKLAGLPLHARGLYLTLLCRQWMEGHLPAEEAALARAVRVPPAQFRAAWSYISADFPVVGEGARAHLGLAEQRRLAAAKGAAARAAVGVRWAHSRGTATSVAGSLQPGETGNSLSDNTGGDTNVLHPHYDGNTSRSRSRSRSMNKSSKGAEEPAHTRAEPSTTQPQPRSMEEAIQQWEAQESARREGARSRHQAKERARLDHGDREES